MKLSTSTLLAGLLATTLGAAAVAPAAAQDAAANARPGEQRQLMLRHHGGERFGMMRHHRGGRAGLLMLACSERGADRLEHMLLSLSQRLDPTAEQQPLLDDFGSAALAAQASFAESCAELRPDDAETAAATGLPERLRQRIAVDEARLAAMNEVLPALDALYAGLTDEQKALLELGHGKRGERHGMRGERPVQPAMPQAPQLDS